MIIYVLELVKLFSVYFRTHTNLISLLLGRTKDTAGYWSHDLQLFMYNWFVPTWAYNLSGWYLLKGIDSSKQSK